MHLAGHVFEITALDGYIYSFHEMILGVKPIYGLALVRLENKNKKFMSDKNDFRSLGSTRCFFTAFPWSSCT